MKYFTQYSYTFTNNNVTEIGNFEMQTGTVQASARAWDPATFLLMNKVVSTIVVSGAGMLRAGRSTVGKAIVEDEMITLYRSISKADAESIKFTKQLTLGEGALEVKQFWQTKEGLDKFNKTGFGRKYNLEIKIPKSMLGKDKVFNTATQVLDEVIGTTATVGGSELKAASQSIQTFKITPIKR